MGSSWLSSFWASPSDQLKPAPTDSSRLLNTTERAAVPISEAESSQPVSALQSVPQNPDSQPRKDRGRLLFTAGAAFTVLSLLVTRRAFARRRLVLNPPLSAKAPGNVVAQSAAVSAPMEAVEALNIATINVLSVAMMGFGGCLWYLGINSMEDARRLIRGGPGADGTGRSEKEAEEEFEEWLASTLARKEAKEKVKGERET